MLHNHRRLIPTCAVLTGLALVSTAAEKRPESPTSPTYSWGKELQWSRERSDFKERAATVTKRVAELRKRLEEPAAPLASPPEGMRHAVEEVAAEAEEPRLPDGMYRDIFVAVHGIGAQQRNATVRAVANRFATSAALADPRFSPQPLGYFHCGPNSAVAVQPLDGRKEEATLGFAEVFWANIPQAAVKDEATLEEIKAWGRTVAARAQSIFQRAEWELDQDWTAAQRAAAGDKAVAIKKVRERRARLIPPDFSLAAEVIDEVVDTIQVLENLSYLADKAGLFRFDMRELLEQYVGDVQVVAEFKHYREHIIGRLHSALDSIYTTQKGLRATHAEFRDTPLRIHLVAHSEGTVVAFYGLLHALHGDVWKATKKLDEQAEKVPGAEQPAWLDAIYGLMTFGSPIDKHLLLWRELTDPLRKPLRPRPAYRPKIRWRNYYDKGDPIGFDLDSARRFLRECGDTNFQFCACTKCQHDIGFERYILPGKAHNDYWEDAEVFEHYIRTVVKEQPVLPVVLRRGQKAGEIIDHLKKKLADLAWRALSHLALPENVRKKVLEEANRYAEVPSSRLVPLLVSWLLPYLFSALLLAMGTFVLYREVTTYLHPGYDLMRSYIALELGLPDPGAKALHGTELMVASLAVTALIAGTTIASRLPRLALGMHWRASVCWLLGAAAYVRWLHPAAREAIGAPFTIYQPKGGLAQICEWLGMGNPTQSAATLGVLAMSLVVVAFGYLASRPPLGARRRRPHSFDRVEEAVPLGEVAQRRQRWWRQGCRPLILSGTLVIIALIWQQTLGNKPEMAGKPAPSMLKRMSAVEQAALDRAERSRALLKMSPPLWPLLLAGGAFLYLWWLSTLIFDLSFVWQRYIRGGVALTRLRMWRRLGKGTDPDAPLEHPDPVVGAI